MKRILFQGDSITDCRHDRENDRYPGSGYSTIVAGRLSVTNPGEYEILNRGISGNRIVDLFARIKKDCINLNPDIVSILIGINGIWHEISEQNGVDAEKYEKVYDMIMSELSSSLPNTRFIILEPFVMYGSVTCPTDEHPDRWEIYQRETPIRARIAKHIADKYEATFIPLQSVFEEACAKAPSTYWLVDGVHPTVYGHGLIAEEWIKHSGIK